MKLPGTFPKDRRMNIRQVFYCAVSCGLFMNGTPASAGNWSVDAETGIVNASRADVRIPSVGGTGFNFTDDLESDSAPYFRVGVSRSLGERHSLRLELVPLTLKGEGTFDTPVNFNGTTFAADTPTTGHFRFNTWRLEYLYRMDDEGTFRWQLGGTLLVRDAEILVQQGTLESNDDNLGVVPLIGFGMQWDLHEKLQAVIEGNALASPQGRAEDVFLGLRFAQGPRTDIHAGYRILEGGADNDDVYTFALFNHLAIGASWRF